jgi:hypothetical protein
VPLLVRMPSCARTQGQRTIERGLPPEPCAAFARCVVVAVMTLTAVTTASSGCTVERLPLNSHQWSSQRLSESSAAVQAPNARPRPYVATTPAPNEPCPEPLPPLSASGRLFHTHPLGALAPSLLRTMYTCVE